MPTSLQIAWRIIPRITAWNAGRRGILEPTPAPAERGFWATARRILAHNPGLRPGNGPKLPETLIQKRQLALNVGRHFLAIHATAQPRETVALTENTFWFIVANVLAQQPHLERTLKIRDPKIKESVDVKDGECRKRTCYWPRPDPGSFQVGRGYRSNGNKGWVCGTRHAHGCPSAGICEGTWRGEPCRTSYVEGQKKCEWCGAEIPKPADKKPQE